MSTKPISARNFLLRKLWTTCFLLSAQHIHNIAADVDGDERPPICSSRILSESVDSFYSCALLLLLLLISSPFLQHSVFFTFSISNQPIKMKLFWGQLICIYEKTLLSLLTAFQRGTINSAFAQFSPIYFNYQKCNWRPYISDCHSQGHANKIPIIANPFHFCFAHLVPYFRLIMCVPYTKLSKSHSILITYCVRYFSSSVVFCGNKKETTISVISACHRTWNIFISHSCKNKRKTAHAQHSTQYTSASTFSSIKNSKQNNREIITMRFEIYLHSFSIGFRPLFSFNTISISIPVPSIESRKKHFFSIIIVFSCIVFLVCMALRLNILLFSFDSMVLYFHV